MANGTYGIVRPADITPEDVEIFYHFTASRDSIGNVTLQKLEPSSDYLIKVDNPNKVQSGVSGFEIFGGMYTLKLPTDKFRTKGFYTIIIKPVEIRTRIVDVGVLSAYPDTKGIIFDISSVPTAFTNKFENNGLVGYRIEYLTTNPNEAKINNFYRVITSNNRAEPVNQNLTNTNQKAIRYRFNDNSTLTYCTVTPSSAASINPNVFPFIGQPNQQVIITNTFFNPLMLEVEMVQHDIETLAFAMFGNQTKSLDDGIYTIYNFNNDIYKQYNLYEIKDVYTGTPLFEVRESLKSVDFSKAFDKVTKI